MKQTISPNTAVLRLTSLVLTGALLVAPAHAEDIYKWVNENNQTQYTQMPPPPGVTAVRIQSKPRPYAGDEAEAVDGDVAEVDEPALDETDAAGDDFADSDEAAPASDREAEIARAMQENCNNARKNLQTLNRGQVRYVSPDGEIIRLDEEERQQRIEEAKEQIRALCKS